MITSSNHTKLLEICLEAICKSVNTPFYAVQRRPTSEIPAVNYITCQLTHNNDIELLEDLANTAKRGRIEISFKSETELSHTMQGYVTRFRPANIAKQYINENIDFDIYVSGLDMETLVIKDNLEFNIFRDIAEYIKNEKSEAVFVCTLMIIRDQQGAIIKKLLHSFSLFRKNSAQKIFKYKNKPCISSKKEIEILLEPISTSMYEYRK